MLKPSTKVIWIEALPTVSFYEVIKRNKKSQKAKIEWHTNRDSLAVKESPDLSEAILAVLTAAHVANEIIITFSKMEKIWNEKTEISLNTFLKTTNFERLKNNGLLFI